MEFWGIEVKAGQPLKVKPELGKLIHISQAALGEVKDVKGAKYVPLRLKIDDKNFIVGSLSAEDRPQLMFDLVFEREFELSHDWKNGSIYFIGYVADDPASDVEDSMDEFDSESEDEPVDLRENGEVKPKSGDGKAVKNAIAAAMAAAKDAAAASAAAKKGELSESDDDEDGSESDSDDDMALDGELDGESSDDVSGGDYDEDDSSEEELPKQSKKRPAAEQTPVPAKKAKSSTPDKTGNKKGPISTPFPTKGAGKAPTGKTPPGDKAKQTPKSGGQFSGKSGNKSFNKNAKGKHGGK